MLPQEVLFEPPQEVPHAPHVPQALPSQFTRPRVEEGHFGNFSFENDDAPPHPLVQVE